MMLKRYNIYIAKHIAWSGLLITASLTSIIWLTQSLRFIDFIVNRGVPLTTFVYMASLLIPSLLMSIMPIALFAAVLFTYNKLTTDSEMVVMKSAGLSRMQIVKPALMVAAGIMLFGYLISFYVLPVTYRQFKDLQYFLRNNYASLLLQEEVFNTPAPGLTVFIREREDNGMLKGILVHDNRQTGAPITMMAREGKLVQTQKGPRFILGNGNRQERRNGRLSILNFDSYTLDVSFYTAAADARQREPEERFIDELLRGDSSASPAMQAKMRGELYQRFTWPLISIALTLVAAAFTLSGEFNRRGQWRRMFTASVAAIGCIIVVFGLNNAAVNHFWAGPLLYVAIVGITGAALWVLAREKMPPTLANPYVIMGG